jgi:hypothetical protein
MKTLKTLWEVYWVILDDFLPQKRFAVKSEKSDFFARCEKSDFSAMIFAWNSLSCFSLARALSRAISNP